MVEYEPYPGAWGRFPDYIDACHERIDRLEAALRLIAESEPNGQWAKAEAAETLAHLAALIPES